MTRTMYDSTNIDAIPENAEIVAGYPHAFPTDYSRFPKALQVRIDQHGNHPDDCHVADVESGAITIANIRFWVTAWHKLHPHGIPAVNGYFDVPTVYVSDGSLMTVRQQLVGLVYDVWVAWWGTGPTVVPGTSLHQFDSPSSTPPSPGDYDTSVVYDNTWGVRPVPVEAPWKVSALADLANLIGIIKSAP